MQDLSMLSATAKRRRAATWTTAALLALSATAAAATPPVFKIYVDEDAPYRVNYEDLVAAGLDEDLPSAGVQVLHDDHPIPTWVEDGGDGTFGSGDWVEFLGEHPPGWISYNDEHSRYNVYFLRFDTTDPLRMTEYLPGPVEELPEPGGHHTHRRLRHYEYDFFLQRIPPPDRLRPEEAWLWAKLSHLDREPFTHHLDLGDLVLDEDGGPVDLRIELRGWSTPANKPTPETPDHRVEVLLNGEELAAAEWSYNESYLLSIPDIPAKRFKNWESNLLTVRIPKRPSAQEGQWLIDVILLNWIEVDYPRLREVGGLWADFHLREPLAPQPMRLKTFPENQFILYGRNGSRMTSDVIEPRPGKKPFLTRTFYPATGESSFVVVGPDDLVAPAAIVRDRPSRLADSANRADYIMIAHRRLLPAIEPLAELHRSRGLDVEVVDVQDVYDEFAGGRARPRALRAFLDHAYHRWTPPAPRYVLLVGDASSNGKDVEIGDESFTDYVVGDFERPAPSPSHEPSDLDFIPYADETDVVNRQLIPTWSYATPVGRSAGDNHFVTVDGDDNQPDMAIGRFPVVEPQDVTNIVDKVIRYVKEAEVGPWRRNMVLLTNTLRRFHLQSRKVAEYASTEGYSALEIYSTLDEPDNEVYTRQLTESLDQGQLLVHYLGHGGRYVWETGQRDLVENRDLFGLEHLESLAPNSRLPVVLSLTCFTAPFDHPEADSIGEKFLRIADRGAIAVVASSSSNAPSGYWGQILLEELLEPGTTVGDAILRSKHRILDSLYRQSYNLLGDPAVPVALPAGEIALRLNENGRRSPKLRGELDLEEFSGRLLVELLDDELGIKWSTEMPLDESKFTVKLDISAEALADVRAVRAYAWDVTRGVDAAGALDLAPEQTEAARKLPWRRKAPPKKWGEEDNESAASAEAILADAAGWWSFEEAEGTAVHDRLDGLQGSLNGRADRDDGPRGGVFDFYGRGFLDVGSDPRLNVGSGDFTLHFWMSSLAARRELGVILDKRTDTGYHLYNYLGRIGLQLAGDGRFTNFDGPFVADGEWHHIAVTVDRDRDDGLRWFVDGREAGPRMDPTADQGSLDNPAPLYIGGRPLGGGNFVGELDEIGIFRRALNAAEIERLYQEGWDWLRPE